MSDVPKPKPKDAHDFLQETLSDLLDRYPGVLILVRCEDGSAVVVAGGAADAGTESAEEYKELIRAAPEIIRLWSGEHDESTFN